MFSLEPVKKLSRQMTSTRSERSRSHRCEPMKPAPPVTRIRTAPNLSNGCRTVKRRARDEPAGDVFPGGSGVPADSGEARGGRETMRQPLLTAAPGNSKFLTLMSLDLDPRRRFDRERHFGLLVGGLAGALGIWWLYRGKFPRAAPGL